MLHLTIPLLTCLLHLSLGQQEDRQCSEFSDFGYFCVPYYQCDRQNKIITDGEGLIDPRFVDEPDCSKAPRDDVAVTSKCKKLLEVCCLNSKHKTKCKPTIKRTLKTSPVPIPKPTCGKRNNAGIQQASDLKPAVGESEFGEWPHVCILLKKEYVGEQEQLVKVYQCGASLIAEEVVLTSGHCVNDTENLQDKLIVRCGDWDSQSELEDLPFQERDVEVIQKHPCFDVDNHHHNFALLFLKSAFMTTSHISPVCLPQPGAILGDQNCVSNGWGKDKFGAEGKYSNILKQIVIPMVENSKCQQLLRDNTRLGPYFELDDSFICAGGLKGIDTCKGDGGSPLTCRQPDGPWFQAGIVSWGIGCGENNIPAVYANVASASCWIDNMVKCHFDMAQSFFGFSDDCPTTSTCSKIKNECPEFTIKNYDVDVEIFV